MEHFWDIREKIIVAFFPGVELFCFLTKWSNLLFDKQKPSYQLNFFIIHRLEFPHWCRSQPIFFSTVKAFFCKTDRCILYIRIILVLGRLKNAVLVFNFETINSRCLLAMCLSLQDASQLFSILEAKLNEKFFSFFAWDFWQLQNAGKTVVAFGLFLFSQPITLHKC